MLESNAQPQVTTTATHPRILPVDVLLLANAVALIVWSILFYYQHFLKHHSTGTPAEFLFYAGVTLAVTLMLWTKVRRMDLGWKILIPLQVLLVLHMLGGIIFPQGVRLYDYHLLFGLTYDKVVHAYAGFAVALVVLTVVSRSRPSELPFANVILVLVVMGISVIWELVEYAAYALIPFTGVGSYDNNMLDLLANLFGAILFVAQPGHWRDAETAPHPRKALPDAGSRLGESKP